MWLECNLMRFSSFRVIILRLFLLFLPTSPTYIHTTQHITAAALFTYLQGAKKTIDLTTELLGNPTLESELAAAVTRGVYVRLISPLLVNGASTSVQQTQNASFVSLAEAGVDIHVTVPPETYTTPYMHARSAIVDGGKGGIYIGSISLSEDSITFNREVGLILKAAGAKLALRRLQDRFNLDWATKSQSIQPWIYR